MEYLLETLRKKFEIPGDFIININKAGGNSLTFIQGKNQVDIEIGQDDELLAMIAKIKMGLLNPLLATYYFQKDITEKEVKYANAFISLISPLLDAWEMKTINKYAPDLIMQELKDIADMMKNFDKLKKAGAIKRDNNSEKRIYISLWTMAHALEMTDLIKIEILYFFDNTDQWERYLKTLRELAVQEPDPYLLPKLSAAAQADYAVKVTSKPYWYFDVREK